MPGVQSLRTASAKEMQITEYYNFTLILSEVDTSTFEPIIASYQAQGINFVTLAEEQRQEPQWLSLFCDLENETRRGIDEPRTVEQMAERLTFLKVVPEALFIAKVEGCYLGYTCLNVAKSDKSCLIQGWTGVRPDYRRRGIATSLKMLGIIYAKEHGYEKIVTSPRKTNTASVRMSLKVGFRQLAEAGTEKKVS